MASAAAARALDHVALLPVVAGRDARVALDLADLLRRGLTLGDQCMAEEIEAARASSDMPR